jgi:hypothetical protein
MLSELDALKKRLYGGDIKAKNVKFFPGSNADSTPEDMARAMNLYFADPKEPNGNGDVSAD